MDNKKPPMDYAGAYPFKSLLITEADREDVVKQYGEVVAEAVDKVVASRGDWIMESFARTMTKLANSLKPEENGPRLLSHADAATMLGVSVATIKRMVQDKKLPEPVQISHHRIGHRIEDLKAICETKKPR